MDDVTKDLYRKVRLDFQGKSVDQCISTCVLLLGEVISLNVPDHDQDIPWRPESGRPGQWQPDQELT